MKCSVCNYEGTMHLGVTSITNVAVPDGVSRKRNLFKCLKCHAITIYPIPSDEQLALYYVNYADMGIGYYSWHKRNCVPVILDLSEKIKGGKVLDIGCGNGQLMNMLPPYFEKYGIELSEVVCREARSKGISVLCSPWESAEFDIRFHLVVCLDFIEHVKSPSDSLIKIFSILAPGGYVVIETGNASSLPAKVLGQDWAYTSIFGHLCALTSMGLVSLAQSAGFEVVDLIKGYHSHVHLRHRLYRWFLTYGFRTFRLVYRPMKLFLDGVGFLSNLNEHSPPNAPLPDHMIFIGRKPLHSR